MAAIGIWSELTKVNEYVMFLAFLAIFLLYFTVMNNICRVTKLLHKYVDFTKPV